MLGMSLELSGGGPTVTSHCERMPAPERGGKRRFAAQVSGAALAIALGALFAAPADAATPRDKAHRHGGAKHAQPAEKTPNGPLIIVVSIASQKATLYADGAFVARGPVSTGMRGHPTPVGVFTVLQKDRYHRSNIYSAAPMPWMQRITWSGVAIHQGVLPGYPASHGCIRTSTEFAMRLWGITKLGVRVIVSRTDVAPAEIANPHLFTPKLVAKAEPAPDPKPELASARPPLRVALADPTTPDRPGTIDDAHDVGGGDPVAPAAAPAASVEPPPAIDVVKTAANATMQTEPPRKPGAVSVFVSSKTGRLYVRLNYQPLFDVPVEIRNPERALGTHVYTALDVQNDGSRMRWAVVTMPGASPARPEREAHHGKHKSHQEREVAPPAATPAASAADALNRVEMPKEAVERISEMLIPGSSLIISDQPISGETGRDTDFIILTH